MTSIPRPPSQKVGILTGIEPAFTAPVTISSLEDCLGYRTKLMAYKEKKDLYENQMMHQNIAAIRLTFGFMSFLFNPVASQSINKTHE